jgi:ABC-type maltose transport system permease subunit
MVTIDLPRPTTDPATMSEFTAALVIATVPALVLFLIFQRNIVAGPERWQREGLMST